VHLDRATMRQMRRCGARVGLGLVRHRDPDLWRGRQPCRDMWRSRQRQSGHLKALSWLHCTGGCSGWHRLYRCRDKQPLQDGTQDDHAGRRGADRYPGRSPRHRCLKCAGIVLTDLHGVHTRDSHVLLLA